MFGHNDGLDQLGLGDEWTALRRRRPKPLLEALRSRARMQGRAGGAVLSLASVKIVDVSKMTLAQEAGLCCVILYGTRDECRASFWAREDAHPRGLTPDHWERFNTDSYRKFSVPEAAAFRVPAFADGRHRSRR